MTEQFPTDNPSLNKVLDSIASPVDRASFKFFYDITQKEGLDTLPSYTWDQFEGGVAGFNGISLDFIDDLVVKPNLIPNYTPESTEAARLVDNEPMLDALGGPFIKSIHRHRQEGAVRVIGIHPSMATPFLMARSLISAYQHEYDEDIRNRIHIVVGAYPTVMSYEIDLGDGEKIEISPVDIGRSLGNLVLTAPKTANTETDHEEVTEWMSATRANFKIVNREILSEPGNILIVHPAGRRGVRSKSTRPPFVHTEHMPDSNLGYITSIPVPTYAVGVDDNLLNNASSPRSVVNMQGDHRPYFPTTDKEVIEVLRRSAELASHGDTKYKLEGKIEQLKRLGRRAVGKQDETYPQS